MVEPDSCPVCGSKMGEDAKACSICGTAFDETVFLCPLCESQIDESADMCPNCGAELRHTDAGIQTADGVEVVDILSKEERGEAQDIATSVFVDVELEELVKLPGIGPLRAKILFDAGYTELRKLKQASVVELMNIRGIGRKAAGEIKTALRELSLEQIRETPLTEETVGSENQCPLCATIVSAFESSCYECGCNFKPQDLDNADSDRLALSYYDSKLLRSPDNKDLWYARGATLVKMENYEQALNSFNKAIELDPSFQTAWMSKAEVYNRLGDSAKAAECYSHIITSASGGTMPGMTDTIISDEEKGLSLEPPSGEAPALPEPPAQVAVAEPDFTQPPEEFAQETQEAKSPNVDLSNLDMDYNKPPEEKPDLDSMGEAELKKELSKRATRVKPYLKLAKEIDVDINHAKKLVARAVTESKQNEFKIAIMLMDEGIEFAEGEFCRKIRGDIEGLAAVIRDLKAQGKDVSAMVHLITETKELLETGMVIDSAEKLKSCLESVESLAR